MTLWQPLEELAPLPEAMNRWWKTASLGRVAWNSLVVASRWMCGRRIRTIILEASLLGM